MLLLVADGPSGPRAPLPRLPRPPRPAGACGAATGAVPCRWPVLLQPLAVPGTGISGAAASPERITSSNALTSLISSPESNQPCPTEAHGMQPPVLQD